MKLEGHHGEIWALAVGKFGNFVVTGSHDRSIRVWEKTEEPVIDFIILIENLKTSSYTWKKKEKQNLKDNTNDPH